MKCSFSRVASLVSMLVSVQREPFHWPASNMSICQFHHLLRKEIRQTTCPICFGLGVVSIPELWNKRHFYLPPDPRKKSIYVIWSTLHFAVEVLVTIPFVSSDLNGWRELTVRLILDWLSICLAKFHSSLFIVPTHICRICLSSTSPELLSALCQESEIWRALLEHPLPSAYIDSQVSW